MPMISQITTIRGTQVTSRTWPGRAMIVKERRTHVISLWIRLADADSLSPLAVKQITEALAVDSTASAATIRAFFDRPDLEAESRRLLIASAPATVCAQLLGSPHCDPSLSAAALGAHPQSAEVLAACAGSRHAAALMPEHLRALPIPTLIDIAHAIRYSGYHALAEAILEVVAESSPDIASIEAQFEVPAEPGARLDVSGLLSAIRHAHKTWRDNVYTVLLAIDHKAWPSLAKKADPQGSAVRTVLLECAERLSDDALMTCLPDLVSPADKWGDDEEIDGRSFGASRRLGALQRARRFPRFREIAGEQFAEVLNQAISLGWKPEARHEGFERWDELHAAAFFTQDPALIDALAQFTRPPAESRRYLSSLDWQAEAGRRTLLRLLLESPAVADATRTDILDTASTDDLRAIGRSETTDEHVRERINRVLRTREQSAGQAVAAQLESRYPLPDDDELAADGDPQAALLALIRNTRQAPTARRVAALDHILASHHLTEEIAWHLPAARLLDHAEYGPRLAQELAELCGVAEERWQRLRSQASPSLSPNLSAYKLIERITKA